MKPAVARFVDGRLFSPNFNDYYAARDPVAETVHVHIQPANLVERMCRARTFTIFEFGFGAGINFLTMGSEFLKHADSNTRLRFISCEAFPLSSTLISDAHAVTSVDRTLSEQFLDFYPPLVSGIYRRLFASDQIELTLFFADAQTALNEFLDQDSVGVDAWILDGFAPDRNPEMWDLDLLSKLEKCTKPKGTVTTFSSASSVRRSLERNGFAVRRIEGTPFKRQTLLATLNKPGLSGTDPPLKTTIVGGGFAGSTAARAFARRGVQVRLLTPTGTVGNATSGIPTAVLHPRLSASMEVPPYFRTQTYFFSAAMKSYSLPTAISGAVQLTGKNMTASRLKDISNILDERWAQWIDTNELNELTGIKHDRDAAFFPKSFVVEGEKFCHSLTQHPNIDVVAQELTEPILDERMIYATGSASLLGDLADSWEVLTIEGQLDTFTHTNELVVPRRVLIQDGYVVPNHSVCDVGSTYEYTKWEPGIATATNLEKLQTMTNKENWTHLRSFRGHRTVTSDKLPIVGQISPNSWVNLAHGSAGTASTPYSAEILASQYLGELAPLWLECIDQIHPNRFSKRQVRRPNPFQHYRR